MNDLENEDSKKDTLVDVVFKKALKEFRQNIFSFYSSALAVSWTVLRDISGSMYEKFGSAIEDSIEAMLKQRFLEFLVFVLGVNREKHTDQPRLIASLNFLDFFFFFPHLRILNLFYLFFIFS